LSSQILLSGGDKWYSYSGSVFGDVTVPASIQLILIPNTGLRDSYIKLEPYFEQLVSGASGAALGIEVKINDVTVIKARQFYHGSASNISGAGAESYNLFVSRQSKLEIISLNTSANNTQERGCNLIGYYL